MNIEAHDYSAGFGVFAANYFFMSDDIKNSSIVSRVNKQCHNEFWEGIRNIYSLKKNEVTNEELQKRILTDLTNYCEHYPEPFKINLNQIFRLHCHARLIYERGLWNEVSPLIQSRKAKGDFKEICGNIYPNNNIGSERLNEVIFKIDEWINTNKKKFKLITILNNSDNFISALTIEISYFTGLQKIYLSDQYIKHLPDEMCNLTNLKYIDLSNNNIEEFPKVLCELTKLESINLSYNKIKSLPDDIENLTHLKSLTLSNNLINSISKSVCSLKLSTLNLNFNPINRNELSKKMLAKKIVIAESPVEQKKQQLVILKKQRKLQKEEQQAKAKEESKKKHLIQQNKNQQFLQNNPCREFFNNEKDDDLMEIAAQALFEINTSKRENPVNQENNDLKRRRK